MADDTPFRHQVALQVGTTVLGSLLLPAALAVVVIAQGPAVQALFDPPSCDDPHGLKLVGADEIAKVQASSTLPGDGVTPAGFDAANLVDGDSSTAWVEGADELGTGSTAEVRFTSAADVRLVCIDNGFTSSVESFRRNGRTRLFETTTDAGVRQIALPDKSVAAFGDYQDARVAQGTTMSVKLEILAVNAGYRLSDDDRIDKDTAISELEFWVAR